MRVFLSLSTTQTSDPVLYRSSCIAAGFDLHDTLGHCNREKISLRNINTWQDLQDSFLDVICSHVVMDRNSIINIFLGENSAYFGLVVSKNFGWTLDWAALLINERRFSTFFQMHFCDLVQCASSSKQLAQEKKGELTGLKYRFFVGDVGNCWVDVTDNICR